MPKLNYNGYKNELDYDIGIKIWNLYIPSIISIQEVNGIIEDINGFDKDVSAYMFQKGKDKEPYIIKFSFPKDKEAEIMRFIRLIKLEVAFITYLKDRANFFENADFSKIVSK